MRYLLLLTLLILPQAQGAEEIRLDRSEMMHAMPVMDQGTSGLCYAYATAQLIDAYRFSHGDQNTKHLTSPIHLAARASVLEPDQTRKSMNLMFPWPLLRHSSKIGSCDHNTVTKAFNETSIEKIESKLHTLFKSSQKKGPLSFFNTDKTPSEEKFVCGYLKEFGTADAAFYPSLQAIQRALDMDPLAAVDTILKDICKHNTIELPNLPHTIVEARNRSASERNKLLSAIDTALTADPPQPAGVVMCESALRLKSFIGYDPGGFQRQNCSYHVATVVGRRGEGESTEYLVRNSMGTSCEGYGRECEGGQIWISGKALGMNSSHVFYLSN